MTEFSIYQIICGCRGHDGSACAFRKKNLVEYVGQVEGEGSLPGEILVTCYRYRKTYYISIDFPDVLW